MWWVYRPKNEERDHTPQPLLDGHEGGGGAGRKQPGVAGHMPSVLTWLRGSGDCISGVMLGLDSLPHLVPLVQCDECVRGNMGEGTVSKACSWSWARPSHGVWVGLVVSPAQRQTVS